MCAIIGFVSDNPTPEAINTLKRLFIESKIRGMHAYGYAALQNGQITEHKSNTLRPLLDSIKTPTRLIGHCRYSTSGDYKDHRNNQPIRHGDEWLVFNGVIDMGTKAEMETAYRVKMETENDGELMLLSKNRMKLLKANITYSGLMLSPGKMIFFRNDARPAYHATKYGATFVGSTADILRRCFLDPLPMPAYEEIEWTA